MYILYPRGIEKGRKRDKINLQKMQGQNFKVKLKDISKCYIEISVNSL